MPVPLPAHDSAPHAKPKTCRRELSGSRAPRATTCPKRNGLTLVKSRITYAIQAHRRAGSRFCLHVHGVGELLQREHFHLRADLRGAVRPAVFEGDAR